MGSSIDTVVVEEAMASLSLSTACAAVVSSAKENDEESAMDLVLAFSLNLGSDEISNPKKSASIDPMVLEPEVKQPKDDLLLTLGPTFFKSDTAMDLVLGFSLNLGNDNIPNSNKSASFHPTVPDVKQPEDGLQLTLGPTEFDITSVHFPTESMVETSLAPSTGSRFKTCNFIDRCGKRCKFGGCTKDAKGSTPFCKGHGWGKICSFEGGGICPKRVYGGAQFCVAHGGRKRCAIPECTKSARSLTNFCVRHSVGKRCKFEGCGKCAQGGTDYCKDHGGVKCSWGKEFRQGVPCNLFASARGKTGLCEHHMAVLCVIANGDSRGDRIEEN